MRERPIIFSTEMVQAILDGRKTVTRRVIKPQPVKNNGFWELYGAGWSVDSGPIPCVPGHSLSERNPYGKPGDILYVRETWGITKGRFEPIDTISYKADSWHVDHLQEGAVNEGITFSEWRDEDLANEVTWKSSRYMPKKYSRIWLNVKDVRVERVQDITEQDAIAEGIDMESDHASLCINIEGAAYSNDLPRGSAAIAIFKKLWDSINAKRGFGWESNPWVWVVEFEVVSIEGTP